MKIARLSHWMIEAMAMEKIYSYLDFTEDEVMSEVWQNKVVRLWAMVTNVDGKAFYAMPPAEQFRFKSDAWTAGENGTLLKYWDRIKDKERERIPNYIDMGDEWYEKREEEERRELQEAWRELREEDKL